MSCNPYQAPKERPKKNRISKLKQVENRFKEKFWDVYLPYAYASANKIEPSIRNRNFALFQSAFIGMSGFIALAWFVNGVIGAILYPSLLKVPSLVLLGIPGASLMMIAHMILKAVGFSRLRQHWNGEMSDEELSQAMNDRFNNGDVIMTPEDVAWWRANARR